jgi:hypothetical protein
MEKNKLRRKYINSLSRRELVNLLDTASPNIKVRIIRRLNKIM